MTSGTSGANDVQHCAQAGENLPSTQKPGEQARMALVCRILLPDSNSHEHPNRPTESIIFEVFKNLAWWPKEIGSLENKSTCETTRVFCPKAKYVRSVSQQ